MSIRILSGSGWTPRCRSDDPASVDDTQYCFFAPDVGIVAGIEQLDVSALLIYNRHTKIARVLAATPK